jgi:hypothetical protein
MAFRFSQAVSGRDSGADILRVDAGDARSRRANAAVSQMRIGRRSPHTAFRVDRIGVQGDGPRPVPVPELSPTILSSRIEGLAARAAPAQ